MTSNLKSARQAIEAELAHAREGVAYYSARVEALENALAQLQNVEGGSERAMRATPPASARGRKTAARAPARKSDRGGRKAAQAKRGNGGARRTKRGAGRGAAGLPTTGGDFWLQLVGEEPKSAVDISNAAAAALGIDADQKDQIQKLKQRVSPALASLVSAHKIQDSGSGRERRFFRAAEHRA